MFECVGIQLLAVLQCLVLCQMDFARLCVYLYIFIHVYTGRELAHADVSVRVTNTSHLMLTKTLRRRELIPGLPRDRRKY